MEGTKVRLSLTTDLRDYKLGKWQKAVFQDRQASIDGSKLYFLYDPEADDQSTMTRSRKSKNFLVVFDTRRKCSAGEIRLAVQGRVKMLFALPKPNRSGGTSLVITSQSEKDYGQYALHVWKFELAANGITSLGDPRSLLDSPMTIDPDNFFCSLREDQPELVVISGPHLNVTCVNVNTSSPQPPVSRFIVPGAELSHFCHGFLHGGNVYFLSASPDGLLDYSQMHILSLANQSITTQFLLPDSGCGLPPACKPAALDATVGVILVIGETIAQDSGANHLVGLWILDLVTFKWVHIQPEETSAPIVDPLPLVTTTEFDDLELVRPAPDLDSVPPQEESQSTLSDGLLEPILSDHDLDLIPPQEEPRFSLSDSLFGPVLSAFDSDPVSPQDSPHEEPPPALPDGLEPALPAPDSDPLSPQVESRSVIAPPIYTSSLPPRKRKQKLVKKSDRKLRRDIVFSPSLEKFMQPWMPSLEELDGR